MKRRLLNTSHWHRKISEDQLFYCNQRGISTEDAIALIVNGYAKEVLNKLPMEFAVEAQNCFQFHSKALLDKPLYVIIRTK